jgi:integrase
MSEVGNAVKDYLALRRSLGFNLRAHEPLLAGFVSYLEHEGLDTVTTSAALSWATAPAAAGSSWWHQRLGVVRGFAEYLQVFDPCCEIPPKHLLPRPTGRRSPSLLSVEDAAALMGAARRLVPKLRAATYETAVGLLSVTGMRPGEIIRLDRGDVDLSASVIGIKASKSGKSRQVPVHPTTVEALRVYVHQRDELCPQPQTPSFFVSPAGRRVAHATLDKTFARLVSETGLDANLLPGHRRPRAHDLRHSFAVRTLISFYEDGGDIEERLPVLSTFLGHANPAATYWYLSASSELLELASRRVDQRTRGTS